MKTKSLIAALLLAASSAFAQVPSYVPTNGLVGWWPFNGNANDESGNGHNGIVYGAQLVSDRTGNLNNAYSFDGSSMYISCSNANYNLSNTISLSAWVEVTGNFSQGEQKIISKGVDNTLGHFNMTYSNGPNASIFYSGFNYGIQNQVTGATQHLPNTGWYHVVFVYDGSLLKLYVNNQLEASKSYSNSISNINDLLIFGKMLQPTPNYPPYFFKGNLDDIGIWNRALTQQEITALYNSQTCNSSSNTITADGPTTFCAGNYVHLTSDVVGGTYQWKKNGVNVTSNGTSKTYKATATGSYTCVATCNGTALTSNAIAVTTKTNAFASVSASGATSFCAGDSVTLNCTNLGSNYSVQWYRTNISMENATNYSLVVKQPGTYKVVTKNLTTGCSRISGSAITTNVNCRIANNNLSEPTSNDINEESRTLAPELSQGVNLFPNPNNGSFKFTYEGEVEGEGTIQVINAMGQTIYQSQVTAEDNRINKEISLGDHYQKGIYIVRLLINGGQNDSRMIVQ
jgi:hypothetical protein